MLIDKSQNFAIRGHIGLRQGLQSIQELIPFPQVS